MPQPQQPEQPYEPTVSGDPADFARSVFLAQPFSRFLGAELTDAGADFAEIRLPGRPELRQQHGFLHGGALSYLADNALTFAGGLALGGDALTAEYKINYVRPAVGEAFLARASAEATTRRQAVCRCTVHAQRADGSEYLVAVAQGTVVAADRGDGRGRQPG